MNWAVLIQGIIALLAHFPEYWPIVEKFWNDLHSKPAHAAALAPHADAVRDAIAAAKQQKP